MKKNKTKIAWEQGFYKDIKNRPDKIFREPHENLPEFIKLLKEAGAKKVLDLGCGTGKHLVPLARAGFGVFGMDLARVALETAQDWLVRENLEAKLKTGDIYERLPFADDFFGGVISTKAMHHARLAQIKKLILELERIIQPKGILMVEVPKRHRESQHLKRRYKEIEPGTIIPLEGPEKGVPHHIFESKKELSALFENFEILSVRVNQGSAKHKTSSHYTMFAKLK